ncbi:MAG: Fpg/Nei family DNA glycosylase [Bacillota bacterium]
MRTLQAENLPLEVDTMAELPELMILERQMHETLSRRRIDLVELSQPKCLNLPVDEAVAALTGRRIARVDRRGKWFLFHLDPELYLLLNLGMGADLFYHAAGVAPREKHQLRIGLDDGSGFTCRFWWFGYIRVLAADALASHPETAMLGPDPLTLSREEFHAIARHYPRSNAKSLILDQQRLSGIGNAYAHDILWSARIHPQRRLGTLSDEEIDRYQLAIRQVIDRAHELGGYEPDFFGQGGNVRTPERLTLIGYREGQGCPICGTPIEKLKTGSTSTFICPACQPL